MGMVGGRERQGFAWFTPVLADACFAASLMLVPGRQNLSWGASAEMAVFLSGLHYTPRQVTLQSFITQNESVGPLSFTAETFPMQTWKFSDALSCQFGDMGD